MSNYLTLRLTRLQAAEAWVGESKGLTFLFSRQGSGESAHGHEVQCFSPGDVLVFDGSGPTEIRALHGRPLVFWSFNVSPEHLFPAFSAREISLLQQVAEGLRPGRLYPAGSVVATECHALIRGVPSQINVTHRTQLLQVAAIVLAKELETAQSRRSGFLNASERLGCVLDELSAEAILSLSVPELATKFGCSRRHLNRLFHKHFGCSVANIRMELRLLKSLTFLRNPDSKIIDVAQQSGFNHLGLFNTCFKRRFGRTPTQWRKLNAQRENGADHAAKPDHSCLLRQVSLCPWLQEQKTQAVCPLVSSSPGSAVTSNRSPWKFLHEVEEASWV